MRLGSSAVPLAILRSGAITPRDRHAAGPGRRSSLHCQLVGTGARGHPRPTESRGAIRRSIEDAARAEEEGDLADLTAIGGEEADYYDPPSIE